MARVCGFYRVRAFTDTAAYCKIRTYRVPPTTPCLPIPHSFGYAIMMRDDEYEDPRVGEIGCQIRQYAYSKGQPPPWWQTHVPNPKHFCGKPAQWLHGSTRHPDQRLDWGSWYWGGSVCCLGWIMALGDADGGSALQLGGGDADGGAAWWSAFRYFLVPGDFLVRVPPSQQVTEAFVIGGGGGSGTDAPLTGDYSGGGGGAGSAWSPRVVVTPGQFLWVHVGAAGQSTSILFGPRDGGDGGASWVQGGVGGRVQAGGGHGSPAATGVAGPGGVGVSGTHLHIGGAGAASAPGFAAGGGGGSGGALGDGGAGHPATGALLGGDGGDPGFGGGSGGGQGAISSPPYAMNPGGGGVGGGGGFGGSGFISGGVGLVRLTLLVELLTQLPEGGDSDGGETEQDLHALQKAKGGDEDGGAAAIYPPVIHQGTGGDSDGGHGLTLGSFTLLMVYSASWVVPGGVATIAAELVGGGGAGAGNGAGSVASGGGGGAYAAAIALAVTAGHTLTLTRGAGGTVVFAGDGTAGGDSSIMDGATPLIVAGGGQPGQQDIEGGAGGAGGVATSPEIGLGGGPGGNVTTLDAGGAGGGGAAWSGGPGGSGGDGGGSGGAGGSSGAGGTGSNGGDFFTSCSPGNPPGGGGGGAGRGAPFGGAGADGALKISWGPY